MSKLSRDQLQEWYTQLKTALYEQLNVDLNHREDLGRIRITRINDWHHEDPNIMPDVDIIYPFIPHRPLQPGEESADPMLSYYCYDPPAPDPANQPVYHQWLLDNMTTQPSDDLIQELYDMAAEGQLVVYDGFEETDLHQIQNRDGQITITDNYSKLQFEPIPEPVPMPTISQPSLPAKPNEPEQPGQPPKGFWIRVGDFFGIRTRYTEYVEKRDAYNQYLRDVADWEKVCNQRMADWAANSADQMTQQREQTERFNQYLVDVSNFYMDSLNRFNIAYGGSMDKLTRKDDENQTLLYRRMDADAFWDEQHKKTLVGKLQTNRDESKAAHKGLRDVQESVESMFGPKYKQPVPLLRNDILKSQNDVPSYDVPDMNGPKITDRHAAWICLAFLSDPTVLAENLADDQLENLGSQERYQTIMSALLLKGEEDSDPLFAYVRAARAAGAQAMQEYAQDKPEHLAMILGRCIRRQNELAANQTDLYALKSFGVTASLLEVLDAHPELMKHSQLTDDDLRLARTNVAIYQANMVGLPAKATLLNHALHQKDLSQEELQSAAADLLLMNTINAQVVKQPGIQLKPEEIQQTKQTFMNHPSVDHLLKLDRTELGKAVALSQEQLAQLPQANPDVPKSAPSKVMDAPQISQPQAAPVSHP